VFVLEARGRVKGPAPANHRPINRNVIPAKAGTFQPPVTPAKAGVPFPHRNVPRTGRRRITAFAGMTGCFLKGIPAYAGMTGTLRDRFSSSRLEYDYDYE